MHLFFWIAGHFVGLSAEPQHDEVMVRQVNASHPESPPSRTVGQGLETALATGSLCYSQAMKEHRCAVPELLFPVMSTTVMPVPRCARHDDEADVPGMAEHHLAVVDAVDPTLKPPRRYQVVILNDDYTPMEFVIDVLRHFFMLSDEQATRVTLQVHHQGRAGVGNYSRDVAETKAALVVEYARQHEHPLLCQAEPVS